MIEELSYQNLQNEIIFEILKNDGERIPSIADLLLNHQLFNQLISTKNHTYNYLNLYSRIIKIILREHTNKRKSSKTPFIPCLNIDSFTNLFTDIKLASYTISCEGYVLLSKFKNLNDLMVLKTSKDEDNLYDILYEYFIGFYGINNLRKYVPNFIYTYDIFLCPQFCLKDDVIKSDKITRICDVFDRCTFVNNQIDKCNLQYYLVLEKINGTTLLNYLNKDDFDPQVLISYLIQILFALSIAQDEIDFVHYDLHSNNIILKEIPKSIEIEYQVNGLSYYITTDKIPVIIDLGFSHFIYKKIPFGGKYFPELGILQHQYNTGYDMYKLIFYVLGTLLFQSINHFESLSWILDYYNDKEDVYQIQKCYREYKNNKSEDHKKKLMEKFEKASNTYYSFNNSPKLKNSSPFDLLMWIQSSHSDIWNKIVDIKQSSKTCLIDSVRDSYNVTHYFNRIINNDKELDESFCTKLLEDQKSYHINKLNIKLLSMLNLSNNLDQTIDELHDRNQQNLILYQKNDQKIIDGYGQSLDFILTKTKSTETYLEFINIYQSLYDFLEYFEDLNSHEIERILKPHIKYFYNFKKIINEHERTTSEQRFKNISNYFNYINKVLYDQNDEYIHPNNWTITNDLRQWIENCIYIFQEIRSVHPETNFGIINIESIIYNIVTSICQFRYIIIYLPIRSKKQLYLSYFYDNTLLLDLISTYLSIDRVVLKNILYNSITKMKSDSEIYLLLKPYLKSYTEKDLEWSDLIGSYNNRLDVSELKENLLYTDNQYRAVTVYHLFGSVSVNLHLILRELYRITSKYLIISEYDVKEDGNSLLLDIDYVFKHKLEYDEDYLQWYRTESELDIELKKVGFKKLKTIHFKNLNKYFSIYKKGNSLP